MPMQRVKQWARRIFQGGQQHPVAAAAEPPPAPVGEFERVKRNWEAFGKYDPLWAIVSAPGKQGNRWDVDEFFASGTKEVQRMLDALAAEGLSVQRGRALDFGAGVGRLSQALAGHFAEVDGIDISMPMLEQARKYNRFGERVRYHLGTAERLPFDDGVFDLVYSKIVLQHVGVELQRGYVSEFLRVVKPGGLVAFQAVARTIAVPGTHFESPIETPGGTFTIDMNVFPRDDVERTIASAGGRLLRALPDQSAGDRFESAFYIATR
jgi:SAM-dependent methyltransferase